MSSSIPSTRFPVTAAGCAAIACSAAGAHDTNEAMSTTAAALDDNGDAGNRGEWEPPSPTIEGGHRAHRGERRRDDVEHRPARSPTKLIDPRLTRSPQPGGTGPVATGLLAFRASSSPLLVGYVLAIDSHGFPSLLVNQLSRGGQLTSTVLAGGADAGAALTMVGGAYALQLVALGDKFTVTDSNAGGRQVLSFVDGNMGTYWIPYTEPSRRAGPTPKLQPCGSDSAVGRRHVAADRPPARERHESAARRRRARSSGTPIRTTPASSSPGVPDTS